MGCIVWIWACHHLSPVRSVFKTPLPVIVPLSGFPLSHYEGKRTGTKRQDLSVVVCLCLTQGKLTKVTDFSSYKNKPGIKVKA